MICDTTPLITALCSQHYFNDDSLLDGALAFQRRCDLTLLCAPALPLQADSFLRDGPDVRARFDARLRRVLADENLPWIDIHGDANQRLTLALQAVEASRG